MREVGFVEGGGLGVDCHAGPEGGEGEEERDESHGDGAAFRESVLLDIFEDCEEGCEYILVCYSCCSEGDLGETYKE